MATETLHFESARFAQQLYNNDPSNLQALDHQLGVKATSREGWIKLEGEAAAIDRAKHLFLLLQGSLEAGAALRGREFAHALNIVKHEGVSMLKDIISDRIQTSEKKPTVSAKTDRQKKYIDAIRRHDVTFGIGPAGTGKTYLAVAMALAALREGTVSRIILTRPAVEAGEALGFLPGDLYEKITALLAAAARCLARHAARRGNPETHRARADRDRPAGLHARAHAQPRLYHPGRSAELDLRADVHVSDAPGHRFQGRGDRGRDSNQSPFAQTVRPAGGAPRPEACREHRYRRVHQTRRGEASVGPTDYRRLRRAPRPGPLPRRKGVKAGNANLQLRNRQRVRRLDLPLARRITTTLLRDLLGLNDFDLGLLLVGAAEMARLNETFLRHAGSTDVLSFDYLEKPGPRGGPPAGRPPIPPPLCTVISSSAWMRPWRRPAASAPDGNPNWSAISSTASSICAASMTAARGNAAR